MRLLLTCALALLMPVADAQSEFVRDAGAYVVLDDFDVLRLGDDQVGVGVGGGWRFGNGLDVGVRLGASHTSFGGSSQRPSASGHLAFDLEVGYVARLGRGVGLRVGLQGALRQSVESDPPPFYSLEDGEVVAVNWRSADRNTGGAEVSTAA